MKLHIKNFRSLGKNEAGFSLIEIIVVIVIIGVISAIAARNFSGQAETKRENETLKELEQLKKAIVGDPNKITDGMRTDYGYVGDVGALPTSLTDLVIDPGFSGWNGPYMQVNFQQNPNDYLSDAWGLAYVPNAVNLTIRSVGADATIKIADSITDLLNNTVILFVQDRSGYTPDATEAANLAVVLTLRNGSAINGTVLPGGLCTINNIPMGIHNVTVTYPASSPVNKRVIVNPGAGSAPIEIYITAFE